MEHEPVFEKDAHGYLLPGPVVRYYREHMTYTDTNGKLKRWTQEDVARQLGLTRLAVQNMENKNLGLDSIERRRTLAALLHIPLALLGLTSLEEHEAFIQGYNQSIAAPITEKTVNPAEIQLYKDIFPVFREQYEQGDLAPQAVEIWINRIQGVANEVQTRDNNTVLAELAKYHLLAANTYARRQYDWTKTIQHLDRAKDIAAAINDNELFATACYYVADMYLCQHKMLVAAKELDSILDFIKSKPVSNALKANCLVDAASAHASLVATEADRIYVRKALDEAEKCISTTSHSVFMSFNDINYLEMKADTLIIMKRHGMALECITEAEDYFPTKKRNREYLKIIRAECYVKQKRPEYEEALEILSQVLEDNPNMAYYHNYIARLHTLIAASSYGNAPDVVHLGMALRQVQNKPR